MEMILVLCFQSALKASCVGPSSDLSRDNAQFVFGSMAAIVPTTPKTCAGSPTATRSDIDMEVSPDGVVQGGVVSNQIIGVEGLAMVDGVKTLPEGVLGGLCVLTAAHLGGVFLPEPLIKQGVKRGRGNVPIAFIAQIGQV